MQSKYQPSSSKIKRSETAINKSSEKLSSNNKLSVKENVASFIKKSKLLHSNIDPVIGQTGTAAKTNISLSKLNENVTEQNYPLIQSDLSLIESSIENETSSNFMVNQKSYGLGLSKKVIENCLEIESNSSSSENSDKDESIEIIPDFKESNVVDSIVQHDSNTNKLLEIESSSVSDKYVNREEVSDDLSFCLPNVSLFYVFKFVNFMV